MSKQLYIYLRRESHTLVSLPLRRADDEGCLGRLLLFGGLRRGDVAEPLAAGVLVSLRPGPAGGSEARLEPLRAAGGGPPPRFGHAALWLAAPRACAVFGGRRRAEVGGGETLQDLWLLEDHDRPSCGWRKVSAAGSGGDGGGAASAPAARCYFASCALPGGRGFFLHGGHGGPPGEAPGPLGDAWLCRPGQGQEGEGGAATWTPVEADGAAPPPCCGHSAAVARGSVVIHGANMHNNMMI